MTHRETLLELLNTLHDHPEWLDALLLYVPLTTAQKLLRIAAELQAWHAQGISRHGATAAYDPDILRGAVQKILLYSGFTPPKAESTGYLRSTYVSLMDMQQARAASAAPNNAPAPAVAPRPAASGALPLAEVWPLALRQMEAQLSRASFMTWIRQLRCEIAPPVVILHAADDVSAEWLTNMYWGLFLDVLSPLLGFSPQLDIRGD